MVIGEKMKKVIKDNWKFLLFVLLGGLIGGMLYWIIAKIRRI